MKKRKLIRLPKLNNEEMGSIKGGQKDCDCTCSITTNNGCCSGTGTLD